MDLNIAINRCCPGARYRLNKNDPPHEIVDWRDERPQPSLEQLQKAWEDYELLVLERTASLSDFKRDARKYQAFIEGETETFTLYLKEIL